MGLAEGAAYRLDALDTTGAVGGRGLVGAGATGTGGLWWSDDGRTWTSTGDWVYAAEIDFGRDGMLLQTSQGLIPGGTGLDISTDGGKTWQADNNYAPLGATVCGQGECSYGPDGVITSNGTVFLAVKTNGKAWVSYDGKTWTAVAWKPVHSPVTPFWSCRAAWSWEPRMESRQLAPGLSARSCLLSQPNSSRPDHSLIRRRSHAVAVAAGRRPSRPTAGAA